MIFCYKGWVKVVYEDQGPQFVMNSGDCVLQPPHIRHQVLECSDGLEALEVSCPAEHETYTAHLLELPNSKTDPSRNFSGQRFLFSRENKRLGRNILPEVYSGIPGLVLPPGESRRFGF